MDITEKQLQSLKENEKLVFDKKDRFYSKKYPFMYIRVGCTWGQHYYASAWVMHRLVDKHGRGTDLFDSFCAEWAVSKIVKEEIRKLLNLSSFEKAIESFFRVESQWESIIDTYIQDTIELDVANPEWVKKDDLIDLSDRLMTEFGCDIYIYDQDHIKDKYIAMYKGQIWDIATGGNNSEEGYLTGWNIQQGSYDYVYFPKMGKNLAHRIKELSLRESLGLSRETVKTYLHREGKEVSNHQFKKWFGKWLGDSSWKYKYWMHHDKIVNGERWSVVANYSKDLLINTTEDGTIHVYSGKQHMVVKKLPWLFYHFAKISLQNGKDYSITGVGWPMIW